MTQLKVGEYSKEQLFSILGSTDLSNIKRDLTKQGYIFTTNGRRKDSYRLIITSVPVLPVNTETFRKFCIHELGITENINLDKLAILVCFLVYDKDFIDLSLDGMEYRIKEQGFTLSKKTILKYLNILERNNILVELAQYVYYVPLGHTYKFITREEYKAFWDTYYNGNNYVSKCLLEDLGNKPKKKFRKYFGNALVPAYQELVKQATVKVKEIRKNE